MKPIIDLNKEYGLVFDGGGARGAYQIGAWRALSEAGVKMCSSGYFCGRPEWRPCLYGRSGESRTYLERDGIFPCYGCG